MKKLVALPLVALFALACSEPTTSTAALDLSPSYAKKTPLPAPTQPTTCPAGATCYDFEGINSVGDIGISVAEPVTESPAVAVQHYLGEKSAGATSVMTLGSGGAQTLTFNLYIIGNWLGDQKKIADHAWQLALTCGAGAETLLVDATFSNRVGNYQSFPEDRAIGHHGGLYAATGKDELGYRSTGIAFPTAATDAADATYAIQRVIPACADARTITFRGKDIGIDQIWGIDNITLQ